MRPMSRGRWWLRYWTNSLPGARGRLMDHFIRGAGRFPGHRHGPAQRRSSDEQNAKDEHQDTQSEAGKSHSHGVSLSPFRSFVQ
jgi:hypothetical protein